MSTLTDLKYLKQVVETALLTAQEPLSVHDLKRLFTETLTNGLLYEMVEEIQADWRGRGIELVKLASGWRFRAAPSFSLISGPAQPEKPPRLLRAVMETVAIIAYRQPVTRGDIEAIRGVSVSSSVTQTLTERGWIEVIGPKKCQADPACTPPPGNSWTTWAWPA